MKNSLILLMALALTGGVSADCGTGPLWGLANSENPYTFSTDADPFVGTDCWTGYDGSDADGGSATSGGLLYFDTDDPDNGTEYDIVFVHDNEPADLGVTPDVDKIEMVIQVISFSADNAIVKIEQYPAGFSFPNPNTGGGAIVQDLWDPDITITGPGEYHFLTNAVCNVDTVAVTPVIGVRNGTMVVDEIWIGAEGQYPGTTKAFNPMPALNSINSSGSVTTTSWTNPLPFDGTSPLTVNWRIEKENATDGGGNFVYDPNWGAANGVPTTMVTKTGTDMTFKNFGFLTSPYTSPLADGLYSWRIDITDPSIGGPGTTEGTVWLFTVGDAPAEPNQPVNQFMFLSQDDSALETEFGASEGGAVGPNIRYFEVIADYTDDGKSTITDANFVNLNWAWDPDGADDILGNEDDQRGVSEVSDVHTPGTGGGTVRAVYRTHYHATDPNYSTDIMGYWDILLEVTDDTGTAQGIAGHFEIFETCGEAAYWDPDDPFDTKYDANLDCRTSLPDFADFALQWMSQGPLYE